ncbi:hypothetical protein VD0002_g4977 [Verticillium dahliae]|nr:hypothetical protein VD0002_g4977 [Verticillium dahliae]
MASDFVDMSLIDHPTWCYTDPAGLRPEFLPYTATNSWPDQPDSPSWNRCDELVCAIFSAWDELPRSILHPWTPEQELQAPLRLDGLVNAFQLYLPANPNAFRDWVLRFQNAMDTGQTAARKLLATTTAERQRGWGPWRRHQAWIARWQYIINLRNQGEPGPSRVSRPEWRGLRYPEIVARADWAMPLPWLLSGYAARLDRDPEAVATAFWRLLAPDQTVEGLPAGYGMGVEVSVMGNPRPALQQPSLLQNAGGLAPWRQMQRHVAASQFGVSSLSLHDSMEQMEENRAPKEADSGVVDSTGDDE